MNLNLTPVPAYIMLVILFVQLLVHSQLAMNILQTKHELFMLMTLMFNCISAHKFD